MSRLSPLSSYFPLITFLFLCVLNFSLSLLCLFLLLRFIILLHLFSLLSFSLPPCSLSVAPPLCLPVDINAQARKLQRNRAKGTLTLPRSSNSSFCRSLSETSLNQVGPQIHA